MNQKVHETEVNHLVQVDDKVYILKLKPRMMLFLFRKH